MIILDKPYVSNFLKETILKNNFPVIIPAGKKELNLDNIPSLLENQALIKINGSKYPKLYSNSENSIDWINKNLQSTKLPEIINLFKDKLLFRKKLENSYPNFYYKGITKDELSSLDPSKLPFPVILKPSVGFFSMGVYKITSIADWENAINEIEENIEEANKLYPPDVLNTDWFIIEEFVEGDEYAFDAYFDENGTPVILNIFKHLFSGENDVGDRVYISSKEIVYDNLEHLTKFLTELGKIKELKNFPLHTEVRITKKNESFPIEVNPIRFGGWCTTADSTYFSYGINPIEYFFNEQKPDWEKVFNGRENKLYSIIVLDNSTDYQPKEIKSFDYDKLLENFQNPLEARKMDVTDYNVFGFLFCETDKGDFEELENILTSDLTEYAEI